MLPSLWLALAPSAHAADLDTLVEAGRLPSGTTTAVYEGDFIEAIKSAPPADLHLLGLPQQIDVKRLKAIHAATDAACIFAMDSGRESALA